MKGRVAAPSFNIQHSTFFIRHFKKTGLGVDASAAQ
jgi:hypothetical protein